MTDPQVLIERYVAGELSQEEFAALSQWLSADESNRQVFLAQVDFYRVVRGVLVQEQRELAKQAEASGSSMFDAETLKALLEIQAAAEDTPLVRIEPKAKAPRRPKADALSVSDVISTLSYELWFQVRAHPKHLIVTAAAAVLLLALIVINPFASDAPGPQEIADDTATESNKPAESAQPILREIPETTAVATLTATHNAKWAERASARGSELHAGQKLTLTAGFAEITTAQGAIAIIEAPATIELLNNDNALRLHAGKLVGSCYSESSKGFVVKTEHADITDIGTEFGVQVKGGNVTATVITGEIEMDVPGSAPQRLTQDQTAQLRVTGVNRKLEIKDQLAQGFEALLPRRRLADALRNDPAMIAYWGFEAEDIVDGKLLNRATATQGKMNGTLGKAGKPGSAPTLTDGRHSGTGALRFEAEEFDVVRVSAEDARAVDGLEALTIALWVRPDRMDQASHHLVTKRTGDQCVLNLAMGWDADRGAEPNSLLFNSDLAGLTYKEHATEKDTLVRSGAWTHIAVTFDRGERRYYVNGELIGTKPRAGADKTLTLDAELAIGAQYANALAQATNLDGDLDELFILGRVMPHDEITTLYETGVAQP